MNELLNHPTPLMEWVKFVVLPAIGFLAGIAAQWMLQDRKAHDEIVRALAEKRATALCRLWDITTLSVEMTSVANDSPVPVVQSEQIDRGIVAWYTKEAGALFLSWDATRLLFELLDALRNEGTRRADLERSVSALRTRLKRDCGIYSRSEAGRPITRPRPSAWSGSVRSDR